MDSATMAGGASPINERHDSDFYETPPDCTIALLKHLPKWRGRVTWEPACGEGAISNVLRRYGSFVLNTDIRTTGLSHMMTADFLSCPVPIGVQQIVTNPPFNLAEEFIRRARQCRVPFAFVLKTQFFHAASRRGLFTETGPIAFLPMTWRPAMAPDRGTTPTMEFSWCVWDSMPAPSCYYYPLARPRDA